MSSIVPPATSPRRSRLRGLVSNLLLVAMSFGLAALAAEGAMRLVLPQQLVLLRPDIWEPVDTLGWVHRASVSTTVNTGEGRVRFATDARGFRVGAAGPVDADARVLLLGDSFMEALQVEYERSLAGLLEAQLPALARRPVAVRNAGVSAWDPPHYFLQARRALAQERASVVVVALYLGNDVVTWRTDRLPPRALVERHAFRLPRAFSGRELVDAIARPVNDKLETRSHLFVFFKNRLQTLRMQAGLSADYVPSELLRSEAQSRRWQVTSEICRDIAVLAAAHGARTLFVLLPSNYQVDTAALRRAERGFGIDASRLDVEQPNRLMQAALAAHGLEVLDATPPLRAEQARGAQLYGTIDAHFAPAGHATVARLVAPRIAELLAGTATARMAQGQ